MTSFYELSLILVAVAVISGLVRFLKQPILLGYILTGLFLGPYFLNVFKDSTTVTIFSQMGLSILLFVVGLQLNPVQLKSYGNKILLIGFGQILITFILSYLLALRFNYSPLASVYIGLAIAFSSTVVVLKLLSDKKELDHLYAKIDTAVLLLQDIVAAFALLFISSFSVEGTVASFLEVIIKGITLTLILSIVTLYILPKLSTFFARSPEYLFIFSVAWGFGIATLFYEFGFSVEIGALVAGVALSVSPYAREISARLRSFRDFFTIIFFIYLGSLIVPSSLKSVLAPTIIFFFFIILLKPLIIMLLGGLFGYTKRTFFMSGVSLAQISEFSMILALVGIKYGHLDSSVLSMITLLGMSSILVSSYYINYAESLYPLVAPFIKAFEKKKLLEKEISKAKRYDVILFGCNRVGYDFIRVFRSLEKGFLAVDFDPDVIKSLISTGVNCVYGDAEDGDFLEEISIDKSKVVISTIPDFQTNSYMLHKIREKSEDIIVVLLSYDIEEAVKLYESGATYVILPHFIGGEYAASLVEGVNFDIKKLHSKRNKHIDYLKERRYLGHSHPQWYHHF